MAIGLYLTVVYFFGILIPALIFFGLPFAVDYYLGDENKTALAPTIRWSMIVLAGVFFLLRRKHVERHAWQMFTIIMLTLLAGWYMGGWIGMFVVSLPILIVNTYIAFQLSQVIIPVHDPKNTTEILRRFIVFFAYVFGVQAPFWKSPAHDAREVEKRIDGDKSVSAFIKSLVWIAPHQAEGILKGSDFNVKGPGMFFLEKGEQPFDLVDLRTQVKKSKIKAISREGIPLEARISITFCIDDESYTRDMHYELRRANTLLEREPNMNLDGMFPYSRGRVKSALSMRSTKIDTRGTETLERWEDHILAMAEQRAREILSERSVEELWRARLNEESNAAEEITQTMEFTLDTPLRKLGIRLLGIKVSEFQFNEEAETDKEDEIINLQLSAWSVEWQKRQSLQRANVEAEVERSQHEAQAYAHSVLLTAIAEGLQQARALHPNLPRYVIALHYIGTLEKLLEEHSEDNEPDSQQAKVSLNKAKQNVLSKMRRG